MNIGSIKNFIAAYMGRTSPNDLNPSNLTPAGPNIDLCLAAINAARRRVEKAKDFSYSRTFASLAIGSSGGTLSAAYLNGTTTVTGSITPDLTGTYQPVRYGLTGDASVYQDDMTPTYNLWTDGVKWRLQDNSGASADYWELVTASTDPSGTYTAHGSYTGTATVSLSSVSSLIEVKRVASVQLPVAGGNYVEIEFLTSQEWQDRIRRQIGRTTYDNTKTLAQLGISDLNPVAYQQGQSIYVAGSGTFSFPITARLEIIRFMPSYTADAQQDYFCQFADEYLKWQAILELNKTWRQFVTTQEGSIPEASVEKFADEALQSLIAWDESISAGTSTPPQPRAAK